MKYSIGIIILVYILYSCTSNKIIESKDYKAYLSPVHLDKAIHNNELEIQFWQQRLATDTQSFVSLSELAYNHLSLFKLKGAVADLRKGDSLLNLAAAKLKYSDPEILHGLSQVAITQHQFNRAQWYNEEAANKKGSPYIHALLSFDVGMELGTYRVAKGNLNDLKDKTSFDFLIRKAKYEDHVGNLEGAIQLMEAAFAKVEKTNKKHLYCWALSNLADMYGHAGRVEDAYATYLRVLQKDPAYLYALKGIAWIAYAHDKNTAEAKRILHFITANTNAPDLFLTLSEIAAYEKNEAQSKKYIDQFLTTITDDAYGDMYNKNKIDIYTEASDFEKALILAEREVANRPTPETYSWLAWVHLKKGAIAKAHELFVVNVKGRTFEPEILLKGAQIMEAWGSKTEAVNYYKECYASSFELGPVITTFVKSRLQSLD